ncbi:hypothetical protein HOS47_gp24 [Pseudomonas phage uligo]|uniref:Uncharacterized protein n=1 Tax=Pseudomonas phage uligo TaxID=2048979 RepID=A0A2H4P7M0_9CAUD|nr:hypothetical protein HOS47_gp24 [Pseudomonas phage uligo]ATW58183.1 hypothetical protein [Pseudomonas phage uligo]
MSSHRQREHSYYALGRNDRRTGKPPRPYTLPKTHRATYMRGYNSFREPEPVSKPGWGERFAFWIARKLGLSFELRGAA